MLTAATATYGRKEFAILGRLLFSKKPEIANELIVAYLPSVKPKETEIKNVYKLLIAFCAVNDLKITECTGTGRAKVSNRRIFLCCILHLYTPYFFCEGNISKAHYGLVSECSKVLGTATPMITRTMQQAIVWNKSYPEFAEQVKSSLAKMEDLRQ
jgi:hypothetical protein